MNNTSGAKGGGHSNADIEPLKDMARSKRHLHVEAINALIGNKVARVFLDRDWLLLGEIAKIAKADAPTDLAMTDPALFSALRSAITRYHLRGWTGMTPEKIRAAVIEHAAKKARREEEKQKSDPVSSPKPDENGTPSP